MRFDVGEIKDLVTNTERKRSDWARAADVWEQDWSLGRYEDSNLDRREMDGIDTVVSPDPFNVVQLLQRFVAHEMRIEIPSLSTKGDDEDRSQMIEQWLVTFDIISNRQQGCNHINDMTWQSGVLGRGAAQVLWIGDEIPPGISTDKILPIWRRTLDPRNVGVARGPYWTDYAYHKYKTNRSDIEQRYPNYKLPDLKTGRYIQGYWNEKYEVIDFWYRHKGAIWHCVVINDDFAISPVKTDYPDIPIIEWYADGAPVEDELGRSLSILHPIHEIWKLKCDLLSRISTGLLYHYDPLVIAKNFNADETIRVGPGETIYLRNDQSVETVSPQPNVPMAQAMLALLQTSIDQATFPGVTYGEAPGGVQAGFAINNLAQQAQSRANTIRNNIEAALEAENQLILSLIEAFAPEEGVEIYRRNSKGERGVPLKLTKKIIKGNYENQVKLLPERPMDDTQKILAWSNLVDKGLISKAFFRDEGINVQMPRDEEVRIALEQALQMPEMAQKNMLRALQKSYEQKDWELMIQGTPLQQVWEVEKQWLEQKKAEEEAAKAQRAAEREQKRLQELLEQGKAHIMPDGTIMEGPPMVPPELPPELPPGLEQMGGPFPMGGGPLPPGQMPPDISAQPPGQMGLPPQAAAQFSPDALGMGQAPPGMFDQLLGGPPPSDADLMGNIIPPPQV